MRIAARSRMRTLAIRVLVTTGLLVGALGTVTRAQELPAPEAWAALERGDASMAATIFREALERSPYNAILHYGNAHASLALGRTDAALSSLKRAVQHDPKFVH